MNFVFVNLRQLLEYLVASQYSHTPGQTMNIGKIYYRQIYFVFRVFD